MERLLNTDFFIYIQGSAVKEGIKSASLKDMYKNFHCRPIITGFNFA